MESVVKNFFNMFWNFFKYPVYVILILLIILFFCCAFWFLLDLIKYKHLPKSGKNILKKESFLHRIFYSFPKQFVDDIFNREEGFFPYSGLVIFEGRQGSGKTISLVQYSQQMKKEFPKSKLIDNLGITFEDNELTDWHKLLSYNNGIYGVIACIDETQNWFSSADSKNFPPEMLSVITQNRKNRRIILGTAQNFYLLSKAIRSQTTEIRRCTTLFGCLTIVKRVIPILDSEGNVKEFKPNGIYFFVHNTELRNSYDTYKVINRLNSVGFVDNNINDIDIKIINKLKNK